MGYVALFFEVKRAPNDDFFTDPSKESDRTRWNFVLGTHESDPEYCKNFGQAVSYAVEACKRQHRHCVYSISMSGSNARFIRWDRAGAIVSEAFDIRANPRLLCEFLWCFANLSDAERGYDLTVEAAEDEEEVYEKAIRAHIIAQLGDTIRDNVHLEQLVAQHYERGAVTSFHLPTFPFNDPTSGTQLLVSRPIAIPLSVAGRGTRTYWAVRINDNGTTDVVLLKDTWRYDVSAVDKEGDVLSILNTKHVRNVPRVLYHQDIPNVVIEDASDTEFLTVRYASKSCNPA